jgi:hypothetical protein
MHRSRRRKEADAPAHKLDPPPYVGGYNPFSLIEAYDSA